MKLSSPVPRNWKQFLRLNDNKTELFKLLNSELIGSATTEKSLVVTNGDTALSAPARDMTNLAPSCNHEEADSRIMVHVADTIMLGFQRILVWTVDTDVVVLAVATLPQLGRAKLWIEFGTGKNFRYIPAVPLLVFHAFTGCSLPKWERRLHGEYGQLLWVAQFTEQISEETEASLEYFTILLYDRTATCTSINEVRKLLFTHKVRQVPSLPPTRAALQQHIRRAVLQGGHIWASTTVPYRQMPSPADWVWTCPEQWMPLWTHLPEARVPCPELLKCACRSRCRDCKCVRALLKCTVYCTCKGDCDNA